MNLIVYQYAVLLYVVKDINGLKSAKFLKGHANLEKVCAENHRVFTRVGVSSTIECAFVCSEASGCDAIFFSAVNGSCTGCRKLTDMSTAFVASTANEYYQLVNENFLQWHFGTSGYLLDVSIKMNFTDEKIYCQLFDAHVVVPDSQDEQNFLTDRLSKTPKDVAWPWIGITDTENTTRFLVEHSEKMVNYTFWAPTQPGVNEPCTYFDRKDGWKWHDSGCFYQLHVVCEHD